MDDLSDIREAVQADLTVDSTSSLFAPTAIDLAINRAYRKAGGLFLWPDTEDAKKTSTVNGQEYYDFPTDWRPYSIFRLEVDDEQYGEDPDGSPMNYSDYLIWRRDDTNENSTEKKWSMQWRRYFIYPVPTTDGSNNISVWGQKVVEKLVNDSDVTIFSYHMPECNEAIVLEAVAILKNKTNAKDPSEFGSPEAKMILARAWDRINRDQAKMEKTQEMFYVTDFFSGKSNLKEDVTGNF